MRIELYEGEFVVHFQDESENQRFIDAIRWSGLGNYLPGYINRRFLSYGRLGEILREAERCGVEVDAEVYKHYNERKAADALDYANDCAARAAESERQRKESDWSWKCRQGCGRCKNLRCVGDDDYECKATGELLETENRPEYVGVTYYMFNFKPFPSFNCPYNPVKTA